MPRLALLIFLAFGLLSFPLAAAAQPPEEEEEESGQEATDDEAADVDDESADSEEIDGEEPRLRLPTMEPIELPDAEEEFEAAEETESEELGEVTPGDASALLEEGVSSDPTESGWTAPHSALTLHGYFRVRSELQDTFWLGRVGEDGSRVDPPFSRFRPVESPVRDSDFPVGGCGGEGGPDSTARCDSGTLGFANMRLRLEPTLSLSDDVRVHMQFDVFDNLVLGSTPDGLVTEEGSSGYFERVTRTPRVPLDTFASTQSVPQTYRTSLTDSIVARRAWAEVRNRGLGQLRFGRMGSHWGLGLLANGGDGIDSDFQTDADRIMAITKLMGFYLVAAWDFANEGFVQQNRLDPLALPYDASQDDDVDQYVFAVARRMDEDDQVDALQRGEWVLNGGVYFVYRDQLLSSQGVLDPFGPSPSVTTLFRRNAEAFIPDVWLQFLYRDLRVELEAVMIAGSIENTSDDAMGYEREDMNILQFGAALESEYRLLDDKLGLYFNAGFASGDGDVEGLTVTQGLQPQEPAGGSTDDTISTFRFHPNYRVDLILWRNIMYQVSGSYYFKPGISYDFIRNSFGQLFGLRADLIYSRASSPVQTWGNDPNLGVEIDASLYYRSEDGPDLLDGFYGAVQYGILFPMKGLGYLEESGAAPVVPGGNPSLENAQTLRVLLGVSY